MALVKRNTKTYLRELKDASTAEKSVDKLESVSWRWQRVPDVGMELAYGEVVRVLVACGTTKKYFLIIFRYVTQNESTCKKTTTTTLVSFLFYIIPRLSVFKFWPPQVIPPQWMLRGFLWFYNAVLVYLPTCHTFPNAVYIMPYLPIRLTSPNALLTVTSLLTCHTTPNSVHSVSGFLTRHISPSAVCTVQPTSLSYLPKSLHNLGCLSPVIPPHCCHASLLVIPPQYCIHRVMLPHLPHQPNVLLTVISFLTCQTFAQSAGAVEYYDCTSAKG